MTTFGRSLRLVLCTLILVGASLAACNGDGDPPLAGPASPSLLGAAGENGLPLPNARMTGQAVLDLFEIEGDIIDGEDPGCVNGVPGVPADPDPAPDWASLFTTDTSPHGAVTGINLPANGVVANFEADQLSVGNLTDCTTFGPGSNKNGHPIQTWKFRPGNVPPKDDLTNVYALLADDPTTADRILYIGLERYAENGDSHVDFEINREEIELVGSGGGQGCPGRGSFVGVRRDGDLLVSVDFEIGGTLGLVRIYRYEGEPMDTNGDGIYDVFSQLVGPIVTFQPTPGTICNETLPGLPAGSVCAINSLFDIDGGPWANFNRSSQTTPIDCLPTNGFTEVGLNLTALGVGNTECISSFNAKTRTSQSITSELKDFALFAFDTDNTPPEITCPPDVTLECPADTSVNANGTATGTDTCGDVTITWTDDVTPGCGQTVTIVRTWTATDESSNTASCDQIITVVDTTLPTITCPPDVTLECPADTSVAANGSATGDDTCGTVTITHNDNVTPGCGNTETITRTWTATDECGNAVRCDQIITVVDTTAPTITCPGPIQVECGDPIPAPDPASVTASDTCGSVTVTFVSDVSNGQQCPEVITRTYRAADDCGNTADCTQMITIVDTTPPTVTCPPNVQIECTGPIPPPDPNSVTATDNCGGVTVVFVSDVSDGMTCPETITRTYRGTDGCGNSAECSQLIIIDDTTPPMVTCPAAIQIECTDPIPAPDPNLVTASDGCGGVTVEFVSDISDGQVCPETITRTYRAIDDCGNQATCTQSIVIDDTQAPTVTCPSNMGVQCDVPIDFTITAADNCDANPTINCTFTDPPDPDRFVVEVLGNGVYRLTLTGTTTVTVTCDATDACGNAGASCSFEVSAQCGDQACSPGYWRNHPDEWCPAGFNPTPGHCFPGSATKFVDAFGITDFSSPEIPSSFKGNLRLLEAVNMSGGTFNQTLFHGSAALLSASHPGVNFGATAEFIRLTMRDAFAGVMSFQDAFDIFRALNDLELIGGCPLN